MLSLLQASFHLKLLCQMVMRIFEKVDTEFLNETDHLVVHFSLLVHIDRKIWLICSQVHFLSFFVVSFGLELACLMNLNLRVLALGQVTGNDELGLIPLVRSHIHFKGLHILVGIDEVLFCEVELSHVSIVLRNLPIVGASNFWWLVRDELHCSVPFTSCKSRLNCLVRDVSLHEMLNGKVELLLGDEPVTPLFFESDYLVREGTLCQVNCLSVVVALPV